MSDEIAQTAIIPVREQIVDFYGDTLLAGQIADGTILVPMRPIADALGLDWSSQIKRLRRDPVLAEALQWVVITTTHRGEQRALALPLDLLPGWLFGISAVRVRPELQEKITRYRRECFRVLWEAFRADIVPSSPAPAAGASGAALALEIAEAVAALARQQLALEGRFDTMAEYLRGYILKNEQRVSTLELRLSSGATISEAEAAEIALAVKNVGKALEGQGDRAGYAKVYSEMYRRYRISSYKNLPAARYQEVLDWLHGWYEELSK
jgi:hypothetical protein